MIGGTVKENFQRFIFNLFSWVNQVSLSSKIKGRLLALPLGLSFAFIIPVVRLMAVVEEFIFFILNFFGGALNLPNYSFEDSWLSLKRAFLATVQFVVSLIMGPFIGILIFCTMLTNPVTSSQKFISKSKF